MIRRKVVSIFHYGDSAALVRVRFGLWFLIKYIYIVHRPTMIETRYVKSDVYTTRKPS